MGQILASWQRALWMKILLPDWLLKNCCLKPPSPPALWIWNLVKIVFEWTQALNPEMHAWIPGSVFMDTLFLHDFLVGCSTFHIIASTLKSNENFVFATYESMALKWWNLMKNHMDTCFYWFFLKTARFLWQGLPYNHVFLKAQQRIPPHERCFGDSVGPHTKAPNFFFEKKIEVEKFKKCAQGHRNHKVSPCIKTSQARNRPDPGIMADGLVDEDLASRLASEEMRS